MGYDGITLHNSINIGKIYSIHYFEYMNDFSFEGESHNFWEFICVDKGEVGRRRLFHHFKKRGHCFSSTQRISQCAGGKRHRPQSGCHLIPVYR